MRTHSTFFLLFCLLCLAQITNAQRGIGLPLQPDKLAYAKEVEQEAITKNDTLLMAEAYYLYGKIHIAARDYLTAKDYFIKSLRIVEGKHKFDKVSRIYIWLSWMEREQADEVKSLEFARQSIAYARISTPKALLSAYQSMSEVYVMVCYDSLSINRKHPLQDSLFYYCKEGERIAYRLNDSLSIAGVSNTLGKVYGFQRNPRTFYYYQIALKIYTALKHKANQASITQQLALTYLQFNQPDKAYPLLKNANELYKSLKIREFALDRGLARTYMQYYQQKQDWKNAFDKSLEVRSFERDEMLADRNGAVSRLGVEYDTEKKEAELKSQRRELELSQKNQQSQRWLLIVLSVLLLGTAAASIAFYQISQKNQRLSQQNAALVQEQNHRVKNNLQLISSLLSLQLNRLDDERSRNAVEDSQRRIEVMGLLQRKLYDGNNLVTVNMADFIRDLAEMVLKAFELEQVEVVYKIEPTVVLSEDYAMRIGLIVNELITNACKYAFENNPKPRLQISATLVNKTFQLHVADNGPGFSIAEVPTRSFGLRLIQMQVEQLFGTYRFENNGNVQFEMAFTLLPLSPLRRKAKLSTTQ
ncbi:sensor histidine kinase [Spirosoma daeguense]